MPHPVIAALYRTAKDFCRVPSIDRVEYGNSDDDGVQVSMLRLDQIHPVLSGNKIFKLHYFLQGALQSSHKKVVTFGGAYSNHLAATAFACRAYGLQCTGLVRGEKPERPSGTLQFCQQQGMQLAYVSRDEYRKMTSLAASSAVQDKFGEHVLIPEGGYSKKGAEGAALISDFIPKNAFSHLCVSVGSATTLAGLLLKPEPHMRILGFPALKGMHDIPERLINCGVRDLSALTIEADYHFRGFAKYNPALIGFMNEFYSMTGIPTDVVYTAKMMFGVYNLIDSKKFPAGSRILCVHTGGLQGNSAIKEQLSF